MPEAFVNGTRLYYIQTGQGSDVVLVHGLASNLAFWYSGIILPLRHRYRVTAFDLRGHGCSDMPANGYTHGDMADDLLKLTDYLKLERFHLIGHSFGSLISLSFALNYPERLISLTLADAPIDGFQTSSNAHHWPDWWPTLLRKLKEIGITIDKDDPYPEIRILESLARPQVRDFIQKTMRLPIFMPYGWGKGSERTANRWLELLGKTTAKHDIRYRKFLAEELGRIKLPTLAMYGTESRWKYSAQILRQCIPQIDTVYIEKAGHFHPWERPDFFIHHWYKFVSALDEPLAYAQRDRRRHERCNVRLPLELLRSSGVYHKATSVNVSNQGLLMESSSEFEVGTELEITATLNYGDRRITLKGIIIRRDADSNTRFAVELLSNVDQGIWYNYLSAA